MFSKVGYSKGIVVSKTSKENDAKKKIARTRQIFKRDKSRFSIRRIIYNKLHILGEYLKMITSQTLMDWASSNKWAVDALRDQVEEQPYASPNKYILIANVKIGLNKGLTYGMRGVGATINSIYMEEQSTLSRT